MHLDILNETRGTDEGATSLCESGSASRRCHYSRVARSLAGCLSRGPQFAGFLRHAFAGAVGCGRGARVEQATNHTTNGCMLTIRIPLSTLACIAYPDSLHCLTFSNNNAFCFSLLQPLPLHPPPPLHSRDTLAANTRDGVLFWRSDRRDLKHLRNPVAKSLDAPLCSAQSCDLSLLHSIHT